MKKILLFPIITYLLIVYLCISAVLADTLSGVVVGEISRIAQPDVEILVYKCHCGQNPAWDEVPWAITTTNEFGGYSICLENENKYYVVPFKEGCTFTPEGEYVEMYDCEDDLYNGDYDETYDLNYMFED